MSTINEDAPVDGQPIVELSTGLVAIIELSLGSHDPTRAVGAAAEATSLLLRRAADARLLWRWSYELQGAAVMVEVPASRLLGNDLVYELIGIIDEFELLPGELMIRVAGADELPSSDPLLGTLSAIDDLGIDVVFVGQGLTEVALAREFIELDVVDGIETEAHLDQAICDGVTLAKGSWIGRPSPLRQLHSVAAWAQWESGPSLGPAE